ncbi:proteophosphoglycan precursor [Pseudomonas sp. ABAC21]|nr:proteophosphoglycan precursor [Pseudomonas sp. ABAC21]
MTDSAKANDLLAQLPKGKGPAPVHLWNPDFCGNIDMRIARDGTWFYQGTPIGRKPMVKLFSNIIRRDGDDLAVTLEVQGQGESQVLRFTTHVDDVVEAGLEHPLRVVTDPVTQEPSPYLRVRTNLEALVHRNVFYQLVELAVSRPINGSHWLGVWSGGVFFPIGLEP